MGAAAAAKRAAAKAAKNAEELTVKRVIRAYLDEPVSTSRKTKGALETSRMLNQFIKLRSWVAKYNATAPVERRWPKLPDGVKDVANLPAKDLTRSQAHALLVAYGAAGNHRPGAMVRQELRSAWRYAIEAGVLPAPSPFEKVTVSKRDNFGGGALRASGKRQRALSKEEAGLLLRWMAEPGTYSRTVRDALELVLRTGLRSGEVCAIHSGELKRRDGVLWLDIPGARMKGGKDHSIPLVGRAEEIVLARIKEKAGYLFPTKRGDAPIAQKVLGVEVYACSGRSRAKAYAARRVCPVTDWAPHDLRRTARSLLASLACPYEVAEAILAHVLPGVAGTYNVHQYDREKIEWLTSLGDQLERLAAAQSNLSALEEAA